MSWLRTLLIVLTLILVPGVQAQEKGVSRKQQEKHLARKEKQDAKARVKQEKADRKRHLAMQDKKTRKRMRKHTKRADRKGSGRHRDPFLKRLFTK
ncbi:MAG: hypothetical protein KDB88_12255 [Flavobacteriales bacterium]|nr:hypothetical protein [Flavobacteriales bacterium]